MCGKNKQRVGYYDSKTVVVNDVITPLHCRKCDMILCVYL